MSESPGVPARDRSTAPVAVTPLLGREPEVAAVRALLDSGDTRLVTLTGAGGIGKTRLALEVASAIEPDFADGTRFVALASMRDGSLLPTAVARALGIQPSGDVTEAVVAELRDRHLLLVLDNLEHVIEPAASLVSELLLRCVRLQVLATSRVALRIAGEQRFPVEPLALPDSDAPGEIDRIVESAAVQLFVERAGAVRPGIAVTETTAAEVAAICRAVDGVPLAIELAAARVVVLSLPALRERLTRRLALLTEGRRDAPVRHQTMRSAIAWSYDLLSDAQQALFRQLSVFVGGFTLEAAEAVGAVPETVDALSALVEHSLVRRSPEDAGGNRFAMLETIREFGLERLEEAGEDTDARDAHAAYFSGLVADMDSRVRRSSPGERPEALTIFLDRLESERDNLRAALAWLTRRDRIQEAMTLAVAIWPFHSSRGHDIEARSTLEALLTHPLAASRTLTRADALHAVGNFARSQGDAAVSIAALDEALGICRQLGGEERVAQVLLSRGWIAMDLGDVDGALRYYSESLRIVQGMGDLERIADVRDMLGLLLIQQNQHELALVHLHDALRVSRAAGNQQRVGYVLNHLGVVALRDGDTHRAARCFEESASIAREFGDGHLLVSTLSHFAEVQVRLGHQAEAQSALEQGLASARKTGYLHGLAGTLAELGILAINRGELASAMRYLIESIVLSDRLGLRYGGQACASEAFEALACLALEVGDEPKAVRFVGMADGLLDRAGAPRPAGEPIYVQGKRLGDIRRVAAQSDLRSIWGDGFALDDEAMVADALAFELPESLPTIAPRRSEAPAATSLLSDRETEVLGLMTQGLTNQEIADALFISRRTVTSHTSNILGKLNLPSRTAVVAWAVRNGQV